VNYRPSTQRHFSTKLHGCRSFVHSLTEPSVQPAMMASPRSFLTERAVSLGHNGLVNLRHSGQRPVAPLFSAAVAWRLTAGNGRRPPSPLDKLAAARRHILSSNLFPRLVQQNYSAPNQTSTFSMHENSGAFEQKNLNKIK